jgi:hemoglobin
MVCWATGGPQQFSGRSMSDSHEHLSWTTCSKPLPKFEVPPPEQDELKAIVVTTKDAIVVSPVEIGQAATSS